MKKKFIELTEHEFQRLVVNRMAEGEQNTPGHNLVRIGRTAFGYNQRNAFDHRLTRDISGPNRPCINTSAIQKDLPIPSILPRANKGFTLASP